MLLKLSSNLTTGRVPDKKTEAGNNPRSPEMVKLN
jgi:hypothetical protein